MDIVISQAFNDPEKNKSVIQDAIDRCHNLGGGKVILSRGVYISKPLRLRSNITLCLEEGAILKASPDIEDYFNIGYYHNEWGNVTSFLYALSEENISIEGKGIIDLSGESFMDFSDTHSKFEELKFLNEEQFQETECKTKVRPTQPIFFYDCKNINLKDIAVKDSPCWTFSINSCENIWVENIKIINNLRVPNSDGLHFCSSKNIFVSHSSFLCGDDCIALTGITDWERFCENVIIENCIMETRSAGIRIGHLDSKVRDVIISNIIIRNSNRGIGIFANGKSGYVGNVKISDLIIDTKIFAGTWWGKGEPIVILAPEEGNIIEEIYMESINMYSENGILVYGAGESVRNIRLKNLDIKLGYGKNRDLFGKYIDLSPSPKEYFSEYNMKIPFIIAKNIHSLCLQDIEYGYKPNYEKRHFIIEGIFENVKRLKIDNLLGG